MHDSIQATGDRIPIRFRSEDRMLVIAPHPDDETIACAGVIQAALEAGATVRVLIVTNGENNPWPQRQLVRRWTIDAEARTRWGNRRRGEAAAALDVLGVHPSQRRLMAWPDLGVTSLLVNRGNDAAAELAQQIAEFSPSHLFGPSLHDLHPDHSATNILVTSAMARGTLAGAVVQRLDYLVHGSRFRTGHALVLTAKQYDRKQRAVDQHHSQLLFGRQRIARLASAVEIFRIARVDSCVGKFSEQLDVRLSIYQRLRGMRVLAVAIDSIGGLRAWQTELPAFVAKAQWKSAQTLDHHGGPASLQRRRGRWKVDSPASGASAVYFKLERIPRGVWIFDSSSWQLAGALPDGQAVGRALAVEFCASGIDSLQSVVVDPVDRDRIPEGSAHDQH